MPDDFDFDPGSEEPEEKNASQGQNRRFGDFDCPSCNANNPYDEKFGNGDEIRCYYCGTEFRVSVDDVGKLRLRET
jgi:transcription elongation factor Elf1